MTNKKEKYQKLNLFTHWMTTISLAIICLTLVISWLLWFFIFHNKIEAMLVNDFSFKVFSIICLTLSLIALILFLLTFFCKKNILTNTISLLNFTFSIIIIVIALYLFSTKIKIFEDTLIVKKFIYNQVNISYTKNDYKLLSIISIPWIIIIISTLILFINSTLNLILNQNKNPNLTSSKNKEEKKEIKEAKILLKLRDSENKRKISEKKWSKKQIKKTWEKGLAIPGVDKNQYRKDYAGAWMFFSDFVHNPNQAIIDTHSYSWTIDNHQPLSHKGTNNYDNLRPLNVINKITKSENYPKWTTRISARGNENIVKEKEWSDLIC